MLPTLDIPLLETLLQVTAKTVPAASVDCVLAICILFVQRDCLAYISQFENRTLRTE
jgi:hypothetical protein